MPRSNSRRMSPRPATCWTGGTWDWSARPTPNSADLVPREAEAVLLVEQEGADPLEVQDASGDDRRRVPAAAVGDGGTAHLRAGPRRALLAVGDAGDPPAFYRLKGPARFLPVVEDMAVPPRRCWPTFLCALQNALEASESREPRSSPTRPVRRVQFDTLYGIDHPRPTRPPAAAGRRNLRCRVLEMGGR